MVTKVLGTTRVKLLAWKGSHGARGKQGVVSDREGVEMELASDEFGAGAKHEYKYGNI